MPTSFYRSGSFNDNITFVGYLYNINVDTGYLDTLGYLGMYSYLNYDTGNVSFNHSVW